MSTARTLGDPDLRARECRAREFLAGSVRDSHIHWGVRTSACTLAASRPEGQGSEGVEVGVGVSGTKDRRGLLYEFILRPVRDFLTGLIKDVEMSKRRSSHPGRQEGDAVPLKYHHTANSPLLPLWLC